ncbi:MAG: spore coat U domain-containing protein [Lysobacter spongiicola]|nr:spore coat U domain-containing protein [Lysobacter spongiicola]
MNAFKSTLRAAMLVACAMAAPALAGQSTTTFEVYLDVANVCTLTKGGDVDFGRVAPTGTAQEYVTSGSLVVRCTLPTAYSITLDQGLHGSGVSDRRMENGNGDAIAYRLYSGTNGVCGDWAGVQWGDGSGGSCVYSFTNYANDQTVQIKGKLTLSEAPAGSYSDTVTATITY